MSTDSAAAAAPVVIELAQVSKRYLIYSQPRHRLLQMLTGGRRKYGQEFWALRDVNLSVRRGEVDVPVGGCPGALQEAIEVLRLYDQTCDSKLPRMHIVFGAYRWATRKSSEHMPGWMTRMSTLTPGKAAITGAGRLEMLPFLREQAVSITCHRFGNLINDWP